MYLLDTNICIAIIQGNSSAVAQFQQKYQECYLSMLVLGELYKGVYCSSRIEQNLLVLNQFATQLPKVNFDENAAREFGAIQGELRQIGRQPDNLMP